MGKEAKGFKPIECCIKDATIGKEYVNSFPLCFSSVKGVNFYPSIILKGHPHKLFTVHSLKNMQMKSRCELLCTANLTLKSQYSPFRRT